MGSLQSELGRDAPWSFSASDRREASVRLSKLASLMEDLSDGVREHLELVRSAQLDR
jgi:hypothetical protein